jgi:hypothetical protein
MSENLPLRAFASECRLGDVVSTTSGPFNAAVVIRITDTEIELFRPYAITSDFETTAGVIPYIGYEEYSIYLKDSVMLLQRGGPIR